MVIGGILRLTSTVLPMWTSTIATLLLPSEMWRPLKDQADVTNDKNFYDVLASHVLISSIETSLKGHIRSGKTALIDPRP